MAACSIMSVLTGVVGGFNLGAEFGGPVVQVYGKQPPVISSTLCA